MKNEFAANLYDNMTVESRGNVRAFYQFFDGGFACYVDGVCDEGFDADESIVLHCQMEDTADYVAINNHSLFWCSPFWGDSLSKLPEKTQELLIHDGGVYRCYLPVCDDTFKTLVRGGEDGVKFVMYSNCRDDTECRIQLAFVCMEGTDPLRLLHDIAKKAADLLGNGLHMREERKVNDVFEYLGWCSWDAMQIRVNHEGLLEKAKEFADKEIPIHYAIIDDMWADVPALAEIPRDVSFSEMCRLMHLSKMRSFRGDPVRFPKDMAAVVSELKEKGIPNVGIWFPTTGYWSGFTSDGEAAAEFADCTEETAAGQILVSPEPEKADKFFGGLCSKVKSWGADFVKIDNQGFHTRFKDRTAIGRSSRAIQNAIEHAVKDSFDGAIINCMGMPSECMFNRKETAICRCSDDFIPESREWFAKNILQCSYNGLLQGQYYVNDWDMWWTDDEQATKNSLCRAVSGGPIYLSDKIGRSRREILKPLTLKNGRILRADHSATPTADCLMIDPTKSEKIFKIINRVGEAGLCAVFNIDAANRAVEGTLCATDIGLDPDKKYAYYEFFGRSCGVVQGGEALNITLSNNDEFRLYAFVPAHESGVTLIGRVDLMIGVKAASRVGNTVHLAECGKVGFVCERDAECVHLWEDGREIPCEREGMLLIAETETEEITITEGTTGE